MRSPQLIILDDDDLEKVKLLLHGLGSPFLLYHDSIEIEYNLPSSIDFLCYSFVISSDKILSIHLEWEDHHGYRKVAVHSNVRVHSELRYD